MADEENMDSFICPITQMVIKEPAATPYGHLYEHSEILKWVRKHGTCPLTNKSLTEDQIVKQYAAKEAITQMTKQQSRIKELEQALAES